MTLTKRPHTLLCCTYESIACEKPFVLSEHRDLMEYFNKGNVITNNDPENIAKAIKELTENYERLVSEIRKLKKELQRDWERRFDRLKAILAEF